MNTVKMKQNGYFGIGILHGKNSINYGTLYRTAQILGADFIFLIGRRFKRQASDTMKSWQHLPLFEYKDFEDFNNHRPYDCKLVGIEMTENATPIKEYKHPKKVAYLLGAEDNGLSKQAINNCQDIIYLQGEQSFNVAVAGSIVLYDRINKRS